MSAWWGGVCRGVGYLLMGVYDFGGVCLKGRLSRGEGCPPGGVHPPPVDRRNDIRL